MLSEKKSRESLIYSLNQALKNDDLPDAKVSISHFDMATGTMYCDNDETYARGNIEEARKYFETVGFMLRGSNDLTSKKKGEYCRIAEEAINIMLASTPTDSKRKGSLM